MTVPRDTATLVRELEGLVNDAMERGDRLYQALAVFDVRDGSPEANLARAAREGYERSSPEMAERDAWCEFDALLSHVAAPKGSASDA